MNSLFFKIKPKQNLHVDKLVDGFLRREGIQQTNNVLVVYKFHNAKLSVGSFGVR